MILAAIDWLTISINLLLVIFVVICLLMTLMILMQRPKQEGLGAAFGGGMTDQMFGARTTNVLQRGTVWFATLFFLLALALAVLIGKKNSREQSLIASEPAETTEAAAEGTPEETLPPDSSIDDTLRSLLGDLPDETTDPETPVEPGPDAQPEPAVDPDPVDPEDNSADS